MSNLVRPHLREGSGANLTQHCPTEDLLGLLERLNLLLPRLLPDGKIFEYVVTICVQLPKVLSEPLKVLHGALESLLCLGLFHFCLCLGFGLCDDCLLQLSHRAIGACNERLVLCLCLGLRLDCV